MTSYDMDSVTRYTQALPRQGQVVDVANAVVYLAGDQSAQVTGVVLPIDGAKAAGAMPANRYALDFELGVR